MRSSTYPQYRLPSKIDYLFIRYQLISGLKYDLFFIGETKAILVSEISCSKRDGGIETAVLLIYTLAIALVCDL